MQATKAQVMSSSQLSFDQGEGKPPAIFEVYYDSTSGKLWRRKLFDKVKKFSIAIQRKTGYPTFLRREHDPLGDVDILYVDIIGARQTYVFFINDYVCDVKIQKEVI